MSAKITLPWIYTMPSRNDDYLVVDKAYRMLHLGYYRTDMGWCINGRWLGHDAVECWQEVPSIPAKRETT